jgi:hypothetical protein
MKLIDSSSDINQLDLANGIKESLIEYGFDLSLLLNTASERIAEVLGIIGCCQNNTCCSGSSTTMTEENDESEPLKDIIESDQAVEPDAKVAKQLRMVCLKMKRAARKRKW